MYVISENSQELRKTHDDDGNKAQGRDSSLCGRLWTFQHSTNKCGDLQTFQHGGDKKITKMQQRPRERDLQRISKDFLFFQR